MQFMVTLFSVLQMNGDTILHIAAQKKDVELARLVCESGAAVNAQNVRHLDI